MLTGKLTTWAMNRVIPWVTESDSPDEVFHAQLVAGISAVFAMLAALYTVPQSRITPDARVTSLCATGTVLFVANLLVLRHRGRARLASAMLLVELVVFPSAAAALTSGYRMYNTAWLICVPSMAIFLMGSRAGVLTGFGIGLSACLLFWFERAGLYVPPVVMVVEGPRVLTSVALALVLVIGSGAVYDHAHGRRRVTLAGTIAQLRTAHAELKAMQGQLVAAEKLSSLGMLAAGIAHEINNPMAFVTANISALDQDLETLASNPELMREYADEVIPATIDGIARVNSIVGDLRRFARGDPEALVDYDLNAEVGAAVRMAKNEVQKRGCRLDVDLAPLPQLKGHPRQMMQVVMNLVVNAAHASGKGGCVRVATWMSGNDVALKVQDDGCGMSEQTRSKLFQPFFTTKKVGEGTGLGLAVVHGIVTRHGGRIDVDSTVGRGSSFTVWVPRAPSVSTALRKAA